MIKSIIKNFLKNRTSSLGIILSCNLIYIKSPFVSFLYSLRVAFPILFFLKIKYGIKKYIYTNTGKIILFKDDIVIKIPLSKFGLNDLENEIYNHQRLKTNSLFSYSLKRRGVLFMMSKLSIPTNEVQKKEILKRIRAISKTENEFLKYDYVINHLIHNVSRRFADLKLNMDISHIKYSPNHNDFTPGNVMEYKKRIVLIDVSKFEFNSYSEFDDFHYDIQKDCLINKTNFFTLFLNNQIPVNDKYIIYFIYRVYFETKLNFNSTYISLAEKTISYFINYESK